MLHVHTFGGKSRSQGKYMSAGYILEANKRMWPGVLFYLLHGTIIVHCVFNGSYA